MQADCFRRKEALLGRNEGEFNPLQDIACSLSFKRQERLKGRKEIREVFGKGKRTSYGGAKLFVLKNGLNHNRICFTFPGNFGTAVERNRAKRLGREAYRHLKPYTHQGYDIILLVYPLPPDGRKMKPDFTGRTAQLKMLLAKAGLLK